MKRLYVYKKSGNITGRKINGWWCPFALAAMLYAAALLVVLHITGYGLEVLQTELLIREVKCNGIDYDAFRDIRVTDQVMLEIGKRVKHVIKRNKKWMEIPIINDIGYLTFSMMTNHYHPDQYGVARETTFMRGIGKLAGTRDFKELYHCYEAIFEDLEYFPVPKVPAKEQATVKHRKEASKKDPDISYINSWNVLRQYGGNRRHEGTDLMADNNMRGYFPVISITDGVVEKLGWLEQGGNRIGIRAEAGGYFYYAHLYSINPALKVGDKILAGQFLGFMGDSGYGREGTIGKFDVHLHLGIYVDTGIGETSFNPYWILRILENRRICYHKR